MLTLLAITRNVHVWIEQPQNSCMHTFSPFDDLCASILTERTCTYLHAFDTRCSCKLLRIFSSHPLVSMLCRSKPAKGKGRLATKDADGKITGNKHALHESQSYPPAFGEAVRDAFHAASSVANPNVFRVPRFLPLASPRRSPKSVRKASLKKKPATFGR